MNSKYFIISTPAASNIEESNSNDVAMETTNGQSIVTEEEEKSQTKIVRTSKRKQNLKVKWEGATDKGKVKGKHIKKDEILKETRKKRQKPKPEEKPEPEKRTISQPPPQKQKTTRKRGKTVQGLLAITIPFSSLNKLYVHNNCIHY